MPCPTRIDLLDSSSPSVTGPADVVEVDRLRLRCVIGVNPRERDKLQDVVICLRIGVDARPAADADCLDAVWDYRCAVKSVIALVEASAYYTVERLVSEIACVLVVGHGAAWARVRVHKPGALRFADSVGIVIDRVRADFPDATSVGTPAGTTRTAAVA
jgi:FolB domain-containing protein